jgi:hypothetical protein
MDRFRVFEIADLAGASPIGEVEVGPKGALELHAEAGSPHAERLRNALAKVGAAKALRLTAREQRGTGEGGSTVLMVRDVAPGEPGYAWAVVDALARGYGFRSTVIEEQVEGW